MVGLRSLATTLRLLSNLVASPTFGFLAFAKRRAAARQKASNDKTLRFLKGENFATGLKPLPPFLPRPELRFRNSALNWQLSLSPEWRPGLISYARSLLKLLAF
jgi:hypothetical protein